MLFQYHLKHESVVPILRKVLKIGIGRWDVSSEG